MISARGEAGLLVCDETAGLFSLDPAVSLIHVGEAHSDRVGDGPLQLGCPQALRAVRGYSRHLGCNRDVFFLCIGSISTNLHRGAEGLEISA
jgi:hypothetical protein